MDREPLVGVWRAQIGWLEDAVAAPAVASTEDEDPPRLLELVDDGADRVFVEPCQLRDPPISRTRYTLVVRMLGEDGLHAVGTR